MIKLVRTNSEDPNFLVLNKALNQYLAIVDGDEHAFYDQYNQVDSIKYVLLAYDGSTAFGCGAIKEFAPDTMEVKRMFTDPNGRGKGVASTIITELENWALEMGYSKCILETGKKQVEAIALYKKMNYSQIPNYGQYEGVENSLCFEKMF